MRPQDTTPNLARLRIDNIKPKWVTCVWLIFFVLLGFLFLLTLAVPESILTYKYNDTLKELDTDINNPYYDITFDSNDTNNTYLPVFLLDSNPKNQFLLIDVNPRLASDSSPRNTLTISFIFDAYEISKRTYELTDHIFGPLNHTIKIKCDENDHECDNRTMVYLNELDNENYMLLLNFSSDTMQSFRDNGVITLDVYVTKINEKYTDFLLALRYLCLGLSIIFLVIYWRNLRKMKGERIVYEQKFIRVLAVLLIFFNDPIYAATVLKPTLASAVFSSFFLITFVCALLLFWISSFERIYRENNQVKSRILTWQKGVYIFFLWLFSVVAYIILSREYLNDPTFDFNDEYHDEFKAFKILMIIFIAIGLGWMFFAFLQILRKYNTIIWRHKMLFSFSTYFIFCYFVFMFTGTMSVYNLNGTKVMLLFGITNVYIWFLTILYAPAGKGFEGSDQPISLRDHIREFNSYEPLDETAGNIEMGKLPASQSNQGDQEEARSPDEIVFQLDNNGNIYERKDPYQVNRQQAYAPQPVNNNNFGFDNNAFGNNQVYGGGHDQENAGENMWKHSEEQKYPFEANNEDES